MQKTLGYVAVALVPMLAHAEDFNYEANFDFTEASVDSTITTVFPGLPQTTTQNSSSIRSLNIGGSWFFQGLSDDKGPRALAPFVDRASSISVGYSDISGSFDSNDVSLLGRYIWKTSGWFVGGSYSSNVQLGSNDVDVSVFSAAVGKYIAQTTSIDLALIRQEVEFTSSFFGSQSSTSNGAVLSFDHLATFNTQWQYSLGASVSTESFNDATGRYTTNVSLYPNRDVSLDFALTGEFGGGGSGGRVFSFGAGWFVTPQLQGRVHASFVDAGNEDIQSPFVEVDTDNSEFGFSIRYRF